MRAEEFLSEIERLTKGDYTGGKDTLQYSGKSKITGKLPGGSGFTYSVKHFGADVSIKIYDPANNEDLIGKLELERAIGFPIKNAKQVHTITVDEEYRGQGIAKALYGIALAILKITLVAGSSQTPGGRRNWVSLSQIPGVDMMGYISVDDYNLQTDPNEVGNTRLKTNIKNIDTIMGELGGQYIGQGQWGNHFFAFHVQPNATGKELEAVVKQKLAQVYNGRSDVLSGLYAVWTG